MKSFPSTLLAASAVLLLAGCPQPTPVSNDPLPDPSPDPKTGNLQLSTDSMPRNSWRIGPPLTHERAGLSAGVLNGQIFAIGGDGEATVDLLDPQADRWRTLPLPEYGGDPAGRSRYFGAAVTAWNRLFYIGGAVDWLQYQMDVYDPGTQLWLDASGPVTQHRRLGRMAHAAATLDDEILVIGGLRDTGTDETRVTTEAVTAVYPGPTTPTLDVYERPPLPSPLAGHGAGVLDSQLYVVGGFAEAPLTGTAEATSSLLRYHANAWHGKTPSGAALAPLNVPRHSFGTAVLDGKLYVAGGYDSAGNALDSVEAYDPKANRWDRVAPMLTPRAHLGLVGHAGRLYAIGGFDATSRPVRTVNVFRP
ncbi:N-acetylneuraminate epimerase [compost metagenome]